MNVDDDGRYWKRRWKEVDGFGRKGDNRNCTREYFTFTDKLLMFIGMTIYSVEGGGRIRTGLGLGLGRVAVQVQIQWT